jgi:DNA-binding NarL/FixJ family response regulator
MRTWCERLRPSIRTMNRSTILIADGHPVVVEGLRGVLDLPEFEIVGVATDGRRLVQLASELQPDLIITAVAMPLQNGIEAAREILVQSRKSKIIFLTVHSEAAYATAALAAGASGYVLKTATLEELIGAIREVLDGYRYVSEAIAKSAASGDGTRPAQDYSDTDRLEYRQLKILRLLAEGRQVKEIAAVLNLSPKTVEFHKYRIMNLLGIHTIADLTRYAVKHGIVA